MWGRPSGTSRTFLSSLHLSFWPWLHGEERRGLFGPRGAAPRVQSRREEDLLVGYPEGSSAPRVGALRSPPTQGLGAGSSSWWPAAVMRGWGKAPAGEWGGGVNCHTPCVWGQLGATAEEERLKAIKLSLFNSGFFPSPWKVSWGLLRGRFVAPAQPLLLCFKARTHP